MVEVGTVTEVVDRGEKSTVVVVEILETGYFVGQAATLETKTDDGNVFTNNSFYLVNPSGRVLINSNDAETLIKYAKDPIILERMEKTGSVSA